jgi:hypothetical protein
MEIFMENYSNYNFYLSFVSSVNAINPELQYIRTEMETGSEHLIRPPSMPHVATRCFKQWTTNLLWNYVEEMSYLRSVSGTLDVMEELVEVRVVTDGGRTGNDSPESHFACI